METIIYAILYVIVTPFWWFVMQIDNALSKLYMHISIKFLWNEEGFGGFFLKVFSAKGLVTLLTNLSML